MALFLTSLRPLHYEQRTYCGIVGNREQALILSEVRRFFKLYGNHVLAIEAILFRIPSIEPNLKKPTRGAKQFYVFTKTFRKNICTAFDYRIVLNVLLKLGWLNPEEQTE